MDPRLKAYQNSMIGQRQRAYNELENDILLAHKEIEELRRDLELERKYRREEQHEAAFEISKLQQLLTIAHEEKSRLRAHIAGREWRY